MLATASAAQGLVPHPLEEGRRLAEQPQLLVADQLGAGKEEGHSKERDMIFNKMALEPASGRTLSVARAWEFGTYLHIPVSSTIHCSSLANIAILHGDSMRAGEDGTNVAAQLQIVRQEQSVQTLTCKILVSRNFCVQGVCGGILAGPGDGNAGAG